MYGIKAPSEPGDEAKGDGDDDDDDDDDEPGDIEASINKELESFKNKPKSTTRQVFTIVKADLECLFFVKTMEPVDPTELVRRICQDARSCSSPGERKLRYINRLTPIVDTDRSTEAGILKVARSVMAPHFLLKSVDESADSADSAIFAEKEDREEKENDSSHPTVSAYQNFLLSRKRPVSNSALTSTLYDLPSATSRPSEVWRSSIRLLLLSGQSIRSISQVLAKSCWSRFSRCVHGCFPSAKREHTQKDPRLIAARANLLVF
jgi:hypothetical protein